MKSIPPYTVALVANTSWSIYNFRAGLIRQLLAEKVKVVIIAPTDKYSAKLTALGCVFESVDLEPYSTNPLKDLKFCWQISKILKKHHIQFLISYTIKPNIYTNFVARWHRIPSIAVVTGLGHLFTLTSWKTVVAKWLYKMALQKVPQVWFLNKEDLHFFVQQHLIRSPQAQYLPSEGIDSEYFKYKKNQSVYLNDSNRPFTFLFAGRLMDEKGIRDYVEAARIVKKTYPQVQFEILGFVEENFPYAVTAQELAAWEKEGIIHYLGSTDQIKTHLQQVNCVVLPSYYREGVPRILLEAASMQLPIITTDNVGCKDIVKHGYNGFLIKKREVQDLVFWLQQMLQLPESERMQMGENGRALVQRFFREDLIIDCYLSVLNQYFAKKPVRKIEESFAVYAELEQIIPGYYQL